MCDLCDNILCSCGPIKWLWVLVVSFDVFEDGLFEFFDRSVASSSDLVVGDFGKEALDLIEPA